MSTGSGQPTTASARARPSPAAAETLRDHIAVFAGRTVGLALRLIRPGGGTALPGMVTNRISPGLLARVLNQPREGIVVVTGSSGKSTTTQMVACILREHGLRVFTNQRTANITKGLVSELLPHLDGRNRLKADVAVLEIDEGYSALVTEKVPARVSILLNVMIDQLHRWHEPERVARYLGRTAAATTQTVVLNMDDPHLAAIGTSVEAAGTATTVRRFALGADIATAAERSSSARRYDTAAPVSSATDPIGVVPTGSGLSDSVVAVVDRTQALIRRDDTEIWVTLPSAGAHIAADAAAAIEGARAILGDRFDAAITQRAFEAMPGVAGRNQRVTIGDHNVDLVFTKSPASMQINLDLLDGSAEQVMVAVGKDIYDTSQLWLVDWSTLPDVAVVSGWQAWDTALRLAYDDVKVAHVEPNIRVATDAFLQEPAPHDGHSTIIYTPEAMRVLRRNFRLDRADNA